MPVNNGHSSIKWRVLRWQRWGYTDECWNYCRQTYTYNWKEKFLMYIMRKEGSENLTLREYIESKRNMGKQWVTYLMGLCEWMAEQSHKDMVMGKK